MAVTLEQFDLLVRRVEAELGPRPATLRRRVVGWAVLGYVGLAGWLGVVFGLAALFLVPAWRLHFSEAVLLYLLGAAVLMVGSWAVLKVLWVRISAPEGRLLPRAEAPALFAVLDELRASLHAARFHRLLVTAEWNASVASVPRLGVLGWSRHYLLLGLPLLDALSPAQMRAVLAHEFANLSRQHGRVGHWLYRLRRSWEKVFAQLAQPRPPGEVSLRPLMGAFVKWFWPRFNAHAFVFSRACEYEADALAAGLAGAENAASALIRIAVHNRHVNDRFWPDFWLQVKDQPEPPLGALEKLRDLLHSGLPAEEGRRCLEQSFLAITTNADTHPCLTDRVKALGRVPRPDAVPEADLLPPQATAAECWLGSALESVRRETEEHWRKTCRELWRQRHDKATALHDRLTTLGGSTPAEGQDVDRMWDQARVLMELEGDKAAEPVLREILALRPAHAAGNFHLGRLLLAGGRAEGEGYLERAMAEDEEAVPPACSLLHAHYRATGQAARLGELSARLDRHQQALQASNLERRAVSASDTLIPHTLLPDELRRLQESLAAEPELIAADLGQKQLTHFPKQRLFVLCVRARPHWLWLPDRATEERLVARLQQTLALPGRMLICAPRGSFRALSRKLAKLPGAAIFRRSPVGQSKT